MISETTQKRKDAITREYTPPVSVLLIGDLKSFKEHSERILASNNISIFDRHVIRPEDSEGKTFSISLKQVKEAQKFIYLTPLGNFKAVIIENASTMRSEAANALLKTLEEPPKYGMMILHSEKNDLLPTIISRCQRIEMPVNHKEPTPTIDVKQFVEEPFYLQSAEIDKIVSAKEENEFLIAVEKYARRILRQEKSARSITLFNEIVSAKRDLKNNVNAKLILELLTLKIIHNVKN